MAYRITYNPRTRKIYVWEIATGLLASIWNQMTRDDMGSIAKAVN